MFHLTPREIELLLLVRQGLTDEHIRDRLGISLATVRTHLRNLYRKTGTHKRVELVLLGGSEVDELLRALERISMLGTRAFLSQAQRGQYGFLPTRTVLVEVGA